MLFASLCVHVVDDIGVCWKECNEPKCISPILSLACSLNKSYIWTKKVKSDVYYTKCIFTDVVQITISMAGGWKAESNGGEFCLHKLHIMNHSNGPESELTHLIQMHSVGFSISQPMPNVLHAHVSLSSTAMHSAGMGCQLRCSMLRLKYKLVSK